MVLPLFGLHVLTRANRRRQDQRRDLSFRNLAKLARIVKRREVTQDLKHFTQTTMDATSDAITMTQQDDSYRRSLDATAVALILPFIIRWRHRLQKKIRKLEAYLLRMKDEYQGCRVKIYSIDQMTAMEYLHGIGWRGRLCNPRDIVGIALRIHRLRNP